MVFSAAFDGGGCETALTEVSSGQYVCGLLLPGSGSVYPMVGLAVCLLCVIQLTSAIIDSEPGGETTTIDYGEETTTVSSSLIDEIS